MLDETEIESYIGSHLRKCPTVRTARGHGSYTLENIIGLSTFMEEKFMEHDLREVKKICYVAEHLYNQGNGRARTSIEKFFVGCLSAIMPEKRTERRELQAIIPISIYSVYVQQFLHQNITSNKTT